jgi:hypothetical protein
MFAFNMIGQLKLHISFTQLPCHEYKLKTINKQTNKQSIYLPRHGHGYDLAKAIIIESVEAHDFTRVDVNAALGHDTDAALRIR